MKRFLAYLHTPVGRETISQICNIALPCIGVIIGFVLCKYLLINWLFQI